MRTGRAIFALLLMTGTVSAQAPFPDQGGCMRPIEQGWTDLNPLAGGSRLVPIDLRQDWDFETLYRIETGERPGWSAPGYFARRHAGITAVFPRSVYVQAGPNQRVAVIPPDTTFIIGQANRYTAERVGLPAGGGGRLPAGGLRLDGRLSLRQDLATRSLLHPTLQSESASTPGPDGRPGSGASRSRGDGRRGVAALLRLAVERERRGRR
ncbi:MAG TPA: hypothetical protein ENK11_04480 [Phycisphaerales bacterium]|nr:hypothetical protein [Phycisphaerales bacterium]